MMTSNEVIKDSVYLVTGGCSGLGKATVKILLEAGGKVVICDLKLPEDNDPIYLYGDDVILPFKGNITSETDIENLYIKIKDKFGKLNGIINCAGIGHIGPVYNFTKKKPQTLEEFRHVFEVNVVGTFNVIRLGIPLLAESVHNSKNKEQAIIINTSSILGHAGVENTVTYSCTKGAIIALTQPLARELRNYGIRVVDVAPGTFDTPLLDPFKKITDGKIPSGFPKRYGYPQEYAQFIKAIIEILFVNGRSMPIDGLHML